MIGYTKFKEEEHYQTLKSWWTDHKWPVIPLESLPDNGIICTYNGVPVCSGFIYKTDSNIAWMEWLLCDPKADKEYRGACIDGIIEQLNILAADMEFNVVFTSVSNKSLINRLGAASFEVSDESMTNLMKVL